MSFIGWLRTAFHSLFHGMKAADEVISQEASYGGGDTEIAQHKIQGGVFADFLDGKETQEVQEARYEHYKVYRESSKYNVKVEGLFGGGEVKATATKKTAADFVSHVKVFNEDGYNLILIQDNKQFPKKSNFLLDSDDAKSSEQTQTLSTLMIERDGFLPRFSIENYANKIVVRKKPKARKVRFDLYTTVYASQFGKVDALFIAELNRIKDNNDKKSDTTDFKSLKFVTDKAFGVEDFLIYEFNKIKFIGINVFDGNFVLTFEASVAKNGEDIVEKYRVEGVDKKYQENAPKSDTIDLFTLKRHIDKENNDEVNLDSTILKL